MQKYRLDHEWKLHSGDIEASANTHTQCYMASKAGGAIGGGSPDFDISGCEDVNLPHDWAVYGEFDEAQGPARGYKPRGKGWYFKKFRLDDEDAEKELYLEFGGVSSHCTVYLNGSVVYRNFCGYNSFVVNITDTALFGEKINTLAVFVNADVTEGWWYEGAGIYRHVDLYKCPKSHIKPWGVFVSPKKKTADVWEVTVKTEIAARGKVRVRSYILNEENNVVGKSETEYATKRGGRVEQSMLTYSPYLWDVDDVHLYTMVTELYTDEGLVDTANTRFGFRTIAIDADRGFFLNGRPLKLYGTCNHQDHAGVGVAVPDAVNEYRIGLLKQLGTNALRCSHGCVDRHILDLCDEYGLLVMDEVRNFNTSPDGIKQLRDMVIRDRNHPSAVMYSVLNEEPLQGTQTGYRLAARMCEEIKELDPTRFTVAAMNGGFMEDCGAGAAVDIVGLNYCTADYDRFKEKFPNKPMISSETDSAFATRGVYKTDYEKHIIDCRDSEAAPWGNTYRDGFRQVDTRDFVMGMFIWTGFDYRGEPTPFEYPSISTQFGIMDTCGFKKDVYYLNKAFFTSEPIIHILPHWNHNAGERIKVMAYTNCTEAELFLNGASLGKKRANKYDAVTWEVDYAPGTLEAVGILDGAMCRDTVKTASAPARIVIETSRDFFINGRDDAAALNVSLADENGVFCPTSSEPVKFEAHGCEIIGVGNGDPNSHEADKASQRHLFNGRAQAVVQKTKPGAASVDVSCAGLSASITFGERDKEPICYIPSVKEKYITTWRKSTIVSEDMPDLRAAIADCDMNTWEVTTALGEDSIFDGKVGYGQYRASVKITPKQKKLVFADVLADEVQIFINGRQAAKKNCEHGERIEVPLDAVDSTIEVAVLFYTACPQNRAGIRLPVTLVE